MKFYVNIVDLYEITQEEKDAIMKLWEIGCKSENQSEFLDCIAQVFLLTRETAK
jgi:hypothetical protein